MSSKTKDLIPGAFPQELNWTNAQILKSLDELYKFVNNECERAICWYYSKKKSKTIFGFMFRIGAILFITFAGIIPILSEIIRPESGFRISPSWATIALAFAALCITLDRFGGYTSGWIRYVRTGQALVNLQSIFQIDWVKEKIVLQNASMDYEKTEAAILKCRDFLFQVNAIVRAETDVWAEDFQKVLVGLDKYAKEKPDGRIAQSSDEK